MLVDSKNWKESWDALEELPGGGQGAAKKVQHKNSEKIGFLKILNKQNDDERRARFYREATAYDSSNCNNIPSLLESNSHFYSNKEYKLYIVTEFIAGLTLSQYVEENGALNPEESSKVVLELLDVVDYYHANGWVHRDIKPDNIILTDSLTPKLLDFGMSFKAGITPDFGTELGQEVGNRFLRLPELMIDSPAKQDIRTDLSFVGGIYFYLLTSLAPISPKDEKGKMPHQRKSSARILKEKYPNAFISLLSFFDKAFSEKLSDRFSSIAEMKNSIEQHISKEKNHGQSSVDQDLDMILESISTKANLELAENKKRYDEVMNRIKSIHSQLGLKFRPSYNNIQSGYVNFSEGLKNMLGYSHFADQNIRFASTFLVKAVGDELIVFADEDPIYRTELKELNLTIEFDEKIQEIFIKGMKELIEKV